LQDDVFCTDRIYENVFFETDGFMAVYNKRPIAPGHILIVPKRHVLRITDLTDAELVGLRRFLDLLLPKLLKAFDADSYNLSINAGENAGETIQHLHLHLVPRRAEETSERITTFYWKLQHERSTYIKDVKKEVERLRKIFKYKTLQKAL
jgi:diadenosine tetraphosphate (Ap4A) HIT family hydrolase